MTAPRSHGCLTTPPDSNRVARAVHLPSPALRPFIREFWITQSAADRIHIILPDTFLVAGFRFDDVSDRASRAVLSGIRDGPRTVSHSAGARVILTRFTETGAAAFWPEPLHLLFNSTVPLADIIGRRRLDPLEQQLAAAIHSADAFLILERFFASELRARAPDPLIAAAVTQIRESIGGLRIHALARSLGLSQSAFERRFRRTVGTSPRRFASIVRFRHILRTRAEAPSLTALAHAAGYSDQSHFIKDFKRFTGAAPESLFRQPSFC